MALGLILFVVVGCSGLGSTSRLGAVIFSNHGSVEVEEPALIPAFIGLVEGYVHAAEFSPDGRWLYLLYGGDAGSIAGVSVNRSPMVVDVVVRMAFRPICFVCSAVASGAVIATRVSLDPPVDPANPPQVTDRGSQVTVEPYQP